MATDKGVPAERMTPGGEDSGGARQRLLWFLGPAAVLVLLLVFRASMGLVMLALAVTAVSALANLPRLFATGAGSLVGTTLMGANRGTAADTLSIEESLIIRGLIAEAVDRFDERIAAEPDFIALRLRAAELHAREANNPARAAELFRQVQSHPAATPAEEILASNRLADLYLGPLKEPQRALVELRRITVRHPGTRAAGHALEGLRTLRASLAEQTPE